MQEKKRVRNADPYLSVRESAEWYSFSVDVIYDRCRRGEIRAIRVGRQWRIRRSDLEAWITEETARAAG